MVEESPINKQLMRLPEEEAIKASNLMRSALYSLYAAAEMERGSCMMATNPKVAKKAQKTLRRLHQETRLILASEDLQDRLRRSRRAQEMANRIRAKSSNQPRSL